jgi:hypothetical protein
MHPWLSSSVPLTHPHKHAHQRPRWLPRFRSRICPALPPSATLSPSSSGLFFPPHLSAPLSFLSPVVCFPSSSVCLSCLLLALPVRSHPVSSRPPSRPVRATPIVTLIPTLTNIPSFTLSPPSPPFFTPRQPEHTERNRIATDLALRAPFSNPFVLAGGGPALVPSAQDICDALSPRSLDATCSGQ